MPRTKKPKKPTKPRRPKGTGSTREVAGVHIGRVPVGKYPNGRTRYSEVRADTKTELERLMRAAGPADPDAVTVAEWAERWLKDSDASPSTKADYKHTLDTFVVPTLGAVRLRALTPHAVEAALVGWSERLGPNTLKKNFGQLVTMLETAKRARLVTENAASLAKRPKGKKPVIRPFTPAELNAIVAESSKAVGTCLFALLATVGCRFGEALALDVGDFDPAAGTVSITKTYDRKHGLRKPKSANGTRTLRVPRSALPALARAVGRRTRGPLFPSAADGRDGHSEARQRWGTMLGRLELDYRNPHQLRHSVGSHLVSRGVSLADVAKFLGDSLNTIVRTYIHAVGADVTAAMEEILDSVTIA